MSIFGSVWEIIGKKRIFKKDEHSEHWNGAKIICIFFLTPCSYISGCWLEQVTLSYLYPEYFSPTRKVGLKTLKTLTNDDNDFKRNLGILFCQQGHSSCHSEWDHSHSFDTKLDLICIISNDTHIGGHLYKDCSFLHAQTNLYILFISPSLNSLQAYFSCSCPH